MTQEALSPDLQDLAMTLEVVQAAGGMTIGSFGRFVAFGKMGLDPFIEFMARGEQLLQRPDGRRRDVDVIGPHNLDRELRDLPHLVDGSAYNRLGRDLCLDGSGSWRFIDRYCRVSRLAAECFAPVEGEVCGIPCVTVRPAAHLALRFGSRPSIGHDLLAEHLSDDERAFLESGAYDALRPQPPNRSKIGRQVNLAPRLSEG